MMIFRYDEKKSKIKIAERSVSFRATLRNFLRLRELDGTFLRIQS